MLINLKPYSLHDTGNMFAAEILTVDAGLTPLSFRLRGYLGEVDAQARVR